MSARRIPARRIPVRRIPVRRIPARRLSRGLISRSCRPRHFNGRHRRDDVVSFGLGSACLVAAGLWWYREPDSAVEGYGSTPDRARWDALGY